MKKAAVLHPFPKRSLESAEASAAPLVELLDVAKHFDVSPPWLNRVIERKSRAVLKAVDGVSLGIAPGETLGLVGESGCGKSTVARLIVGLYRPTRGEIRYGGKRIDADGARRAPRRDMQMIFQDPYASLNPRWRVADIVAEPLTGLPGESRVSKNEIEARVGALLEQVGLVRADGAKFPHQFSGGQRQRISIARALAGNPKFLVCDEPTSALDVSVQAQVLNLMRRLQRDLGLTLLFISHNLAVVHHIADRVGVMYLGRMVEASLHADAARSRAGPRPYREAAHRRGRRGSQPARSAVGLRLSSALSPCERTLPPRGAGPEAGPASRRRTG